MNLGDTSIPLDVYHSQDRAVSADPRFKGAEHHRAISDADRRRADIYRLAGSTLEVDTTRLGRPRARKAGQPWDWYPVCETRLAPSEAGGCLRTPGISGGYRGYLGRTWPCDTPDQAEAARIRQRRIAAEAADFARRLDVTRRRLVLLGAGEVSRVEADLAAEVGAVRWDALEGPAALEGSGLLVIDLRGGDPEAREDVLDHLADLYLHARPTPEPVRPLGIVLPPWEEAPAFCDRASRFAWSP